MTLWQSLGLGLFLGLVHGAMRWATHRIALRRDDANAFLKVTIGGMIVRLFVMLLLLGLTLAFVPVRPAPFVAPLLGVVVVGIILENAWVVRQTNESSGDK
jgi:hypothetical protein